MTDPAVATSEPLLPKAHTSRVAGLCLKSIALFLFTTLLVGGGDLYLKYWSFKNVAGRPVVVTEQVIEDHAGFWAQYPHAPIVVVPGLLNLRLTTNTGAVFGLGKGGRVIFIVVSLIATLIIGVMFARSRSNAWPLHVALALILAGALGNLYDRAVYGAVRDMLHMLPNTRLWPWIFNLADAALMVGVGLVLLLTFFNDRKRKTSTDPPPPPAA